MTRFERARMCAVTLLGAALIVGAAACSSDTDPQFVVNGTGNLEGILFLDANGDGLFDPSAGDRALPNVHLLVQERGTTNTLANGDVHTDANGRFALTGIEIGTHSLSIDTTGVGNAVSFCQNPIPIDIRLDETQFAGVAGQTGCLITIFAAEAKPLTTPVTIRGVVTSATGQIAANTTFIEDATGGAEIFGNISPALTVGQEVEVQGVIGVFNTEIEVTNPKVNSVAAGTPVTPLEVTTKQIADAAGAPTANLPGRLVTVRAAKILDAFIGGGGRNAQVDDGSGAVAIRLERIQWPDLTLATQYPVGKCYDITGIVRPFTNPGIELEPRTLADMVEVPCKS